MHEHTQLHQVRTTKALTLVTESDICRSVWDKLESEYESLTRETDIGSSLTHAQSERNSQQRITMSCLHSKDAVPYSRIIV